MTDDLRANGIDSLVRQLHKAAEEGTDTDLERGQPLSPAQASAVAALIEKAIQGDAKRRGKARAEGLEAARQRGARIGRPPTIGQAKRARIIAAVKEEPPVPYPKIAKRFGVHYKSVENIARAAGVKRR